MMKYGSSIELHLAEFYFLAFYFLFLCRGTCVHPAFVPCNQCGSQGTIPGVNLHLLPCGRQAFLFISVLSSTQQATYPCKLLGGLLSLLSSLSWSAEITDMCYAASSSFGEVRESELRSSLIPCKFFTPLSLLLVHLQFNFTKRGNNIFIIRNLILYNNLISFLPILAYLIIKDSNGWQLLN